MVEKRETYTDQARRLLQLPYDDQLEDLARLYARIDWLQTEMDYRLLKENIEEVREKVEHEALKEKILREINENERLSEHDD
jgi:hypothetical protein